MGLLCQLILLFQVVIIARIVLSWFPLQPGGVMSRINSVLIVLTEWLLGPLRRIVPRVGHARLLALRGDPPRWRSWRASCAEGRRARGSGGGRRAARRVRRRGRDRPAGRGRGLRGGGGHAPADDGPDLDGSDGTDPGAGGSSGSPTTAGGTAGIDYEVGDCLTWEQGAAAVTFRVVDCSEEHFAEVAGLGDLSTIFDDTEEFPEVEVLSAAVAEVCSPVVRGVPGRCPRRRGRGRRHPTDGGELGRGRPGRLVHGGSGATGQSPPGLHRTYR